MGETVDVIPARGKYANSTEKHSEFCRTSDDRITSGADNMHSGKFVFTQVMDHLPWYTFGRCVQRYDGDRKVNSFRCSAHYRCMAFAQLTYRESLRDIEVCLRAQSSKLYHLGITEGVSGNTLANANSKRD